VATQKATERRRRRIDPPTRVEHVLDLPAVVTLSEVCNLVKGRQSLSWSLVASYYSVKAFPEKEWTKEINYTQLQILEGIHTLVGTAVNPFEGTDPALSDLLHLDLYNPDSLPPSSW
jgi:hypothetical protein